MSPGLPIAGPQTANGVVIKTVRSLVVYGENLVKTPVSPNACGKPNTSEEQTTQIHAALTILDYNLPRLQRLGSSYQSSHIIQNENHHF